MTRKSSRGKKTYQARKTNEVPIVVHHIGTLFVIVPVPNLIRLAGRVIGRTVQGTVVLDAVDDSLPGCSLEGFRVGLPQCLDGTGFAGTVPFCVHSIVGPFMVVKTYTRAVQLVDNIRIHQAGVVRVRPRHWVAPGARTTAGTLILIVPLVGNSSPPFWLHGLVLEMAGEVDRRHRI